GQCLVQRRAVPPHGVPGFHQPDPRRVAAAGPALRGRLPNAYGSVAPRWETPDRPPIERVPELPPPDARRPAGLPADLPEDLQPPSGAGTPLRHGPEQSQSVDPCPPARTAGGPTHPWRCPCPFPSGPRPAARCLGGRRLRRRLVGGGAGTRRHARG